MGFGTEVREIILDVNGKNSIEEIRKIEQSLKDATKRRDELQNKGVLDKEEGRKLRELNKTIANNNAALKRMGSTADDVERAIDHLSSESVKDLKRVQSTIERLLESGKIGRGTEDWKKMEEALRQVRGELKDVEEAQKAVTKATEETLSLKDRIAEWGQKWVGVTTVFTEGKNLLEEFIAKAGEYVQAYADMEEQMSGTRKFTGMSEEDVKSLNEAFKKMDTRTGRDKLNELAQEAGRLGKNTKEAVEGYVKAADVINVALDDLGNGATQTLAKLTDIFGVEEQLGTEQALLSVGSVINELSQNCTASAPYLADFAQRMAGVGAQAKMTIPEIMGFGAVLDSQGQAVEMSASALSKLVSDLFKDTEKIAKATGIPLQELNDALSKSTNEGLMLLLEKLNEKGGFDKLAPVFEEMGESGVRATRVLSVLAGKIDEVRAQQEVATEAFAEGKSVLDEYGIFNSTTQAALDRMKNKIQELRIELGEKLMPTFEIVTNVGYGFFWLITKTIGFIAPNIKTILALAGAWTTYAVAVNWATVKSVTLTAATRALTIVQKGLGAVIGTVRIAVLALNVAYQFLTKGLVAAKVANDALKAAMSKTPWGLVAMVIASVVGLIIEYTSSTDKATEATNREAQAIRDLKTRIAEEESELKRLRDAILKAKEGSQERLDLIKEWNSKYGQYMNQLLTEKSTTNDVAAAYERVNTALRQKAILEAKEKWMKENVDKRTGWEIQKLADFGDSQKGAKVDISTKDMKDFVEGMMGKGKSLNTVLKEAKDKIDLEFYIYTTRYVEDATKAERNELKKVKDSVEAYIRQAFTRANAEKRGEEIFAPYMEEITDAPAAYAAGTGADGGGGTVSGSANHGGATGDGGSNTPAPDPEEEKKKELEKRRKAIEEETKAEKIMAEWRYRIGLDDYTTYQNALLDIEEKGYEKQKNLYEEGTVEWREMENKRLEVLAKKHGQEQEKSLKELDAEEKKEIAATEEKYLKMETTTEEKEEELNKIKLKYLKKRQETAERYGDKEKAADFLAQYQEESDKQLKEKREKFMQEWQELTEKYVTETEKETMTSELAAAEKLANELGLSEEQKQKLLDGIRKKYKKNAEEEAVEMIDGGDDPVVAKMMALKDATDMLHKHLEDGTACWEDYAAVACASLDVIMEGAKQVSALMAANAELETAKVEKRYDKEIEAAKKAGKDTTKLEEQKEKEVNAIKKREAKRQMGIDIAEAILNTAKSISKTLAELGATPWGLAMAAVAATMGAIQTATIVKQAQAKIEGYYEGGFTGGKDYRREAGVVHEGEFVANHKAVNNPALGPMFQLLDAAQRANVVGSLTAEDVSRTLPGTVGSNGGTQVVVKEDGSTRQSIERLNEMLDSGIEAYVVLDGERGLAAQEKRYERMMKRR